MSKYTITTLSIGTVACVLAISTAFALTQIQTPPSTPPKAHSMTYFQARAYCQNKFMGSTQGGLANKSLAALQTCANYYAIGTTGNSGHK